MADNYCQFSEHIDCLNEEQADWIIDQFTKEEEPHGCSINKDGNDVIVFSEESGNITALANIVGEFQKKFNITTPWVGSYCYSCSKPRLGEFGGGAVVVLRGKQYWFDATSLADAKAKKLA